MATLTDKSIRNKIIYEVFIRNHSEEGNITGVIKDLDRIKDLGVDILWIMPMYPIGEEKRKGDMGSPYAIKDYNAINPEYGDIEDFKRLVEEVHNRDMDIMIDIVFNHTSPDSKLVNEHPGYFYRNPGGNFGNKVGDWYDIIDLDYSNKELWREMISTLKYWASLGVDGYRCDVAPLVPMEFWEMARNEVEKAYGQKLWLAESVEPSFVDMLRKEGFVAHSDSEVYNVFDIAYDYDVHPYFKKYQAEEISLNQYIEKVRQQEYIYPDNYVKLRNLENHDNIRARHYFPHIDELKMWTAFMYFQKGPTLVYAGQEAMDSHTPSLFYKDMVNWKEMNDEFTNFLKKLGSIKKNLPFDGYYKVGDWDRDGLIYITYETQSKITVGVFNVENVMGERDINIPEGDYKNLISDDIISIRNGKIKLENKPMIFEVII